MGVAQRAELARSAGVGVAQVRLGNHRNVLDPVDARALNGLLERSARTHGVPVGLLKAVAWKESTWDHEALSFDGQHGKGLMQIDDRFHSFASTRAAFDPAASADYGARYLSELRQQHGSWDAALAAYNGSWTYVTRVRQIEAAQPWHARLAQERAQT
ncbi:MAG: lytic transglycosylase domain-containing protein [Armatimonadetes bacterium]|nr:lytic transglycosylase domain-containing protein [Armatimonadota bacterium]